MYFENCNVIQNRMVYIFNYSDGVITYSKVKSEFTIFIEVS